MSVPFSRLLACAMDALAQFEDGDNLDNCIRTAAGESELRSALQSVLYGLMRHYCLCYSLLDSLATRTPSGPVSRLLILALSELIASPEKAYAIVNETVGFAKSRRSLAGSANFINACLRRFGRESASLITQANHLPFVRENVPTWYSEKLKQALGNESAIAYLQLAQEHPKMVLRVNRRRSTPKDWCLLARENGIVAKPVGQDGVVLEAPLPVSQLPGFSEGIVSVQDAGAQLAAQFLAPQSGESFLDACAAPGGKTCHLLEIAEARVTAIEIDAERACRIQENLDRLGLKAELRIADAASAETWQPQDRFDAILLDAPCTASGILRRHPDIAFLRRPTDIVSLAKQQKALLETLWPRLKFGGRLLYVVCSVFKEEGSRQISSFLQRHRDAHPRFLASGLPSSMTVLPADCDSGQPEGMPGVTDGFFYAMLVKG